MSSKFFNLYNLMRIILLILVFGVFVVLAIVFLGPQNTAIQKIKEFLLYLFFLRVPIVAGLFILALPLIAIRLLPKILRNLFVLSNGLSFLLVTILTCAVGVVIVEVGLIGFDNSLTQFQDLKAITNANAPVTVQSSSETTLKRHDRSLKQIEETFPWINKIIPLEKMVPVGGITELNDTTDLSAEKGFFQLALAKIDILEKFKIIVAFLLAFSIILCVFILSVKDSTALSLQKERPSKESRMRQANLSKLRVGFVNFLWILLGLLLSLFVYTMLLVSNPFKSFIDRITTTIINLVKGTIKMLPMMSVEGATQLLEQIQGLDNLLLAYFFVGVIFYFIGGKFFNPKNKKFQAPALYFLLLNVATLCLFFGLVTYFFDTLRIPVLLVFVLWSLASYFIFNVDHFYEIFKINKTKEEITKKDDEKTSKAEDNLEDWNVANVLEKRLKGSGSDTLVVVCAAGGGIQAAGWSTLR